MKGDPLPLEHRVARHCEKRFMFDRRDIGPGNFGLRGHAYLSVDWLEKYGTGTVEEQLALLRKRWEEKKLRTIGSGDKFGVLEVGKTIDSVRKKSQPPGKLLRFLHEPAEDAGKQNDAHSGIYDTADDNLVMVMLAESCQPFPGKES